MRPMLVTAPAAARSPRCAGTREAAGEPTPPRPARSIGEVGDPRNRARAPHRARGRRTTSAATWASRSRSCASPPPPIRATRPRTACSGWCTWSCARTSSPSAELRARAAPRAERRRTSTTTTAGSCARPSASRSRSSTSCRRSSNPLYATPWRSYSRRRRVHAAQRATPKEAEDFFERALQARARRARVAAQARPDPLPAGQHRRGAQARRALQQARRRRAPSRSGSRCASSASSGERVAEQSYANQLRRRFPGSPEYQALQRGRLMTELTGIGAAAERSAREAAGPRASPTWRSSSSSRRARSRRSSRSASTRCPARPSRAAWCATTRGCSSSTPSRCSSASRRRFEARPTPTSSPRASASRCRSPTARAARRCVYLGFSVGVLVLVGGARLRVAAASTGAAAAPRRRRAERRQPAEPRRAGAAASRRSLPRRSPERRSPAPVRSPRSRRPAAAADGAPPEKRRAAEEARRRQRQR